LDRTITCSWHGFRLGAAISSIFVVFGLPVVGLVGALGLQEIRARFGDVTATVCAEETRGSRPQRATVRRRVCGSRSRLVTAAAIHAFVIPEHFREAVTFGLFFLW